MRMKKLFTLCSLIFSLTVLNAQTSIQCWALNATQTATVAAMANGDTITYFTSANALKTLAFKFKNTAAITNTYSVRRTDLVLNSGAVANFGFGDQGTNFSPGTTTPPVSADYSVLLAGASTSTGFHLYPQLNEGSNPGSSFVRYKLFNVASGEFGADTLIFTVHYILDIFQSLNVWALDATQSATTTAVGNNDTVYYTVGSNTTQTVFFQFQNISAATHTYSVRRTDIILHPGASAFFCFGDQGSCYNASTTIVTSDFATLGPGQATTQNSGPPFHADTHLSTDLQEGSTAGYSVIKYKLFDLTTGENGPDTLTFKIMYNATLSGIKENSAAITKLSDIYPNPSTDQANFTVALPNESDVKIQVYNTLGILVHNRSEQKLSGQNKLSVDCSGFNSGLYFITVTAGNSKVTKRLVVNK
jgi:hypothetical protein